MRPSADEFYAPEFIYRNSDASGATTSTTTPERMTQMRRHTRENDPGRGLTNNVIICNCDHVSVIRQLGLDADLSLTPLLPE